ncbi:hypothetical protein D3C71_1928350 [compost metagenome]
MFNQCAGVIGGVHAVFGKAVEFFRCLVIQITTVDHKNNPIHFRHLHDYLACFKRGQRLTRTGGVPDITVMWFSLKM